MLENAVARLPSLDALPEVTTVGTLPALTLAILLLFVGKGLSARVATLRRYSIPEPVVGGVLCAAVVCALSSSRSAPCANGCRESPSC